MNFVDVESAFGSLKLLPGASTRETIEEIEEMLIGIVLGVVRVKSHAHWMVVQVLVKGMRDRRRAGDGKQI
jgi:hypothetical protein